MPYVPISTPAVFGPGAAVKTRAGFRAGYRAGFRAGMLGRRMSYVYQYLQDLSTEDRLIVVRCSSLTHVYPDFC